MGGTVGGEKEMDEVLALHTKTSAYSTWLTVEVFVFCFCFFGSTLKLNWSLI